MSSPLSVFEIMALATSGRLRLTKSAESWIRESLATAGVRLAEVTPAIAIDAGTSSRTALADPVDRLLVATARQLDAALLTSDVRILDYAPRPGTSACTTLRHRSPCDRASAQA